jgi:hypothetical protein
MGQTATGSGRPRKPQGHDVAFNVREIARGTADSTFCQGQQMLCLASFLASEPRDVQAFIAIDRMNQEV